MTKYDFEIALAAWFASMIAAYVVPILLPIVGATTFNLWHQRNILYNAGDEFVRRVQAVVGSDLTAFDERVRKVEKAAVDMTETHKQMAATFTGTRNLPR